VDQKSIGRLLYKVHKCPYFMSRHIEIKHHFIRDHVQKKDIALNFVDTNNQLADIFTKPLADDRFNFIK